jgi:hypothetical protein
MNTKSFNARFIIVFIILYYWTGLYCSTLCHLTAGWSSGLKSRLRNQRSRVQIPVVSRGFCDLQLDLLTSHSCLYTYIDINITYIMYDLYVYPLSSIHDTIISVSDEKNDGNAYCWKNVKRAT